MGDVLSLLASVPVPADGAGMIDQLRGLEDLKCLAGARQAEVAVAFDRQQRREQAAAGVPAGEQGAGVAARIALARRESPAKGSRLLGMAKTLTGMPHTSAAFQSGLLNEWRATLVVKETICLSPEDRAGVDEELAADTGALDGMGDKAIIAAVRAAACRRDPASVARRAAHAVTERSVSLRPAPDTMTYLTALLPVSQGVAAYAALNRDADTLRSAGDERSRGQVMADTLVERITGIPGGISGVEVQLVMTDHTLLQADPEPARLPGYGTIPAAWARTIALTGEPAPGTPVTVPGPGNLGSPATADTDGHGTAAGTTAVDAGDAAADTATDAAATPEVAGDATVDASGRHHLNLWIRRLYTAPGSGELVAMDSKARLFPAGLKRFLQIRDDTCRTPYCDAPIRHHDHIRPWHSGGPTTVGNGQGLCEACNHAKETPGWTAKPVPGARHTVATSTPTGHTYHSTAPPLPGTPPAGAQPRGGTRSCSSQERRLSLARATP
ncbi:HNH endonuclease [Arthrobacter sp. FW306-05-C]|uniref:HNH endonuclease n=1 Tax=Arthrobacter sp. FW306-05-C TaxID=2879620 RepID=UPI001F346515|nr:HNH endonuclease signature motif containing protein [Arthrobacter sp. FW306-05-C]UKA66689.1 HNH endonuclease [Arthrobacter sp. FW306-05-C]